LGHGGYGKVFCVKDPNNNQMYAIKLIMSLKSVSRELKMIGEKSFNPFVLKYYSSFDDKIGTFVVMEYCCNGDLFHWIESQERFLEENEVLDLFVQINEGISYLHSLKIVHNDIKPHNILLNEFLETKISDFGAAVEVTSVSQGKITKTLGTQFIFFHVLRFSFYSGRSLLLKYWIQDCLIFSFQSFFIFFC
jgi:serine/threonine protein kinase